MVDLNELKSLKLAYASNNSLDDVKKLISELIEKYANVNDLNGNDDVDLVVSLQESIVNYIVNDLVLLKYKISNKYKKRFLKLLIELLNNQNYEIYDQLFDIYMSLNNGTQSNDNEKCFIVKYLNVSLLFFMIYILNE